MRRQLGSMMDWQKLLNSKAVRAGAILCLLALIFWVLVATGLFSPYENVALDPTKQEKLMRPSASPAVESQTSEIAAPGSSAPSTSEWMGRSREALSAPDEGPEVAPAKSKIAAAPREVAPEPEHELAIRAPKAKPVKPNLVSEAPSSSEMIRPSREAPKAPEVLEVVAPVKSNPAPREVAPEPEHELAIRAPKAKPVKPNLVSEAPSSSEMIRPSREAAKAPEVLEVVAPVKSNSAPREVAPEPEHELAIRAPKAEPVKPNLVSEAPSSSEMIRPSREASKAPEASKIVAPTNSKTAPLKVAAAPKPDVAVRSLKAEPVESDLVNAAPSSREKSRPSLKTAKTPEVPEVVALANSKIAAAPSQIAEAPEPEIAGPATKAKMKESDFVSVAPSSSEAIRPSREAAEAREPTTRPFVATKSKMATPASEEAAEPLPKMPALEMPRLEAAALPVTSTPAEADFVVSRPEAISIPSMAQADSTHETQMTASQVALKKGPPLRTLAVAEDPPPEVVAEPSQAPVVEAAPIKKPPPPVIAQESPSESKKTIAAPVKEKELRIRPSKAWSPPSAPPETTREEEGAYPLLLKPAVVAGHAVKEAAPTSKNPVMHPLRLAEEKPLPPPAPVQAPSTPLAEIPKPELPNKPTPEEEKAGLRIFAALGINYVQISESLTDVTANYHDIRTPTFHLGMDMDVTDKTSVIADYKHIPIHFDNSALRTPDGVGSWDTFTLDLATAWDSLSDYFSRQLGKSSEFRLLFGFQSVSFPLALFRDKTNAPTLKDLDMINLNLGGRLSVMINPKTRFSTNFDVEYPVSISAASAGASLQATPVFLFGGSVGLDKKVGKNTWVGLYWYGQYQNIQFQFADSDTTASGQHSAVFSAAEMRLTYEW